MNDIRIFYEGPDFMVGNEPCLSEELSVYHSHLLDIQQSSERLNELIDNDIRSTTDRLKQTKSLQEQVNRDIM